MIKFSGQKSTFALYSLSAANVGSPALFENLSADCHPIATKSRRYSENYEQFIRSEVQRLLNEEIIKPSRSSWRSQVVITTNERQKKRMVIDYSRTINRFNYLNAYPVPRIDRMIENISRYEYFSTLEFKSAYHQMSIKEEEKAYTAFEACGNLYQFRSIPLGVTNGVACFHRVIDTLIKNEHL